MSESRKLAAILAADVAGYSRLAGADEERTLARLRGLRSDLIDPAITVHHGRVVKRTGDGILIEFRSVVDAVRCAVEVQQGMAERNTGVPPERQIRFRVGIHLGDVVEEDDGDLMGDGVNIAARLEGIAQPGAICLSEDAYRQVRGRLDLAVTDLGETQLKNIALPIRVYALEVGLPAQPKPTVSPSAAAAKAQHDAKRSVLLPFGIVIAALIIIVAVGAWYFLAGSKLNVTVATAPAHLSHSPNRGRFFDGLRQAGLPDDKGVPRLSIVVLPFQNLSGDPKQDYLADVLTDELTTYISRIPGSFVIARNTAFTYKGKPTDVKEIGTDLGVRYALEGSVQPTDKRIRTNAQLIDTETGAHLWAEEFDTDKTDLLQTEDEIVTRLARTLQIQLTDIEAAKLEHAHPANPDAQELALRCQGFYMNFGAFGPQADAAFNLCQQALDLDPNNVIALETLSYRLLLRASNYESPNRKGDLDRATAMVSRALALDANNPLAHLDEARLLSSQHKFDQARIEDERALALDPSDVDARSHLCTIDFYTGHAENAVTCYDTTMSLSPRDPLRYAWMALKGFSYFILGRDDESLEWLRRGLAANPNYEVAQAGLAGLLALIGKTADAHAALKEYLSLPGARARTIAAFKKQEGSDDPAYRAARARLLEGLRKAGMPEQ